MDDPREPTRAFKAPRLLRAIHRAWDDLRRKAEADTRITPRRLDRIDGDPAHDPSLGRREFCGDTKSETLRFATSMTYGCVCSGFPQATSTAHPAIVRPDAPSPLPSVPFSRGTIPHRRVKGGRR